MKHFQQLKPLFKIHSLLLILFLTALQTAHAQDDYRMEYGQRMDYTLEVPCRFYYKKPVGKNIDLNFVDAKGYNINVLILNFPDETAGQVDIETLANIDDVFFVEDLESIGLNNVQVIKRGTTWYGDAKYYFAYYTSTVSNKQIKTMVQYHHAIIRIVDNKLIQLSYHCDFSSKDKEMPYIFRVMQSFDIKEQ